MADEECSQTRADDAQGEAIYLSERCPRYSAFVVAVLTMMFATQYLDRQMVVILAEPLKHEFALTDSQLGLLTGLVFSVPYCLMLLPIGYMVDRFSRKRLLVLALSIWSGLTFLTGFARNLWDLVLARGIIAAAESSNNPASLSLIADHYGPRHRATAIGIFYAGPGIATIVGFTAIGAIASEFGWRAAFFAAGVPGLLLAVTLALAIREPQRERLAGARLEADVGGFLQERTPAVREVLGFIASQKSLVHFMLGMMLTSTTISGQIAWTLPYLMRVHELSLLEASFAISLSFGLASLAGHVLGGYIVDRLARRNVAWIAWSVAFSAAAVTIAVTVSALSPLLYVALGGIAVWALASGCQYGPVMGTIQTLVAPRMRGFTTSCAQLLINLVGAGFGPLLIGGLSDGFEPTAGTRSVAIAMTFGSVISLWAMVHFLFASRTLAKDMARIQGVQEREAA